LRQQYSGLHPFCPPDDEDRSDQHSALQQTNCYGDARSLIADYNAAYAALAQDAQYQGWVTLADVWTGFASPQTQWAYPPLMSGLCAIHFGMTGQLNMGWAQFFMRLRGAMEK